MSRTGEGAATLSRRAARVRRLTPPAAPRRPCPTPAGAAGGLGLREEDSAEG
ncbi:putative cytosolic protein (plasmid) [Roseomonas mucosa]|nr:putative cytosolic protein [Roseomonas mucosa]